MQGLSNMDIMIIFLSPYSFLQMLPYTCTDSGLLAHTRHCRFLHLPPNVANITGTSLIHFFLVENGQNCKMSRTTYSSITFYFIIHYTLLILVIVTPTLPHHKTPQKPSNTDSCSLAVDHHARDQGRGKSGYRTLSQAV